MVHMSNPIRFYDRNTTYFELSNSYEHPILVEDLSWPSVEHYLQASKFPSETHVELREKIRTARTLKKATLIVDANKKWIRSDWLEVCETLVLNALRVKYSDPVLQKQLLNTGSRELVENSPFDRYWGAGRQGDGQNRLGVLLMQLRQELKAQP
ncbi:MAG: ribA/ribD-fused uncharacterized protein [Kiritimatiellia bacterium]|jgi:ribA/ribD-fused uncharacterized protein